MTARSLDDVEAIRRLLHPERRRPEVAQGLRAVTVVIDGRRVRVHFADPRELDDDTIPDRIRAEWARLASARFDEPSPAMHALAARRERALARLRVVGAELPRGRRSSVYHRGIDGRLAR